MLFAAFQRADLGLKETAEPTMKLLTVTAVKIQLITFKTTLKSFLEVGM